MRKNDNTLLGIVISIISFIFSIVAVILSYYNIRKIDTNELNYVGLIVTLLGIIFTIFVGYQIYNVVNMRNELKDFSEQKEALEESVNKLKNFQIVNEFYIFYTRGLFALTIEKYDDSLVLFFKALKSILSSNQLNEHLEDLENLEYNIQFCLKKITIPLNKQANDEIISIIEIIKQNVQISNKIKELVEKVYSSITDY